LGIDPRGLVEVWGIEVGEVGCAVGDGCIAYHCWDVMKMSEVQY
jgi:hypothetical protein